MTGKTHRVGGMLCVLGGFTLLESKGMLLGNVNPVLQLAVMYPFAIYGSVVSDLDHDWHSVPCRDVVSLGINKVLHLASGVRDTIGDRSSLSKALSIFDAKHRSWQTHSDLFLFIMIIVMSNLMSSSTNSVDIAIIRLIFTGLIMGVISHLFLDMLTPEGIWSFITLFLRKVTGKRVFPDKVSLVPDSKFFRTGGAWEGIVRRVLWVLCLILFLRILISISPYSISFLKS